jgi:hypothetical protein
MSDDSGVHDVNNFDLLRLWGERRNSAGSVASVSSLGNGFIPADDCGRIRLKLTARR